MWCLFTTPMLLPIARGGYMSVLDELENPWTHSTVRLRWRKDTGEILLGFIAKGWSVHMYLGHSSVPHLYRHRFSSEYLLKWAKFLWSSCDDFIFLYHSFNKGNWIHTRIALSDAELFEIHTNQSRGVQVIKYACVGCWRTSQEYDFFKTETETNSSLKHCT